MIQLTYYLIWVPTQFEHENKISFRSQITNLNIYLLYNFVCIVWSFSIYYGVFVYLPA